MNDLLPFASQPHERWVRPRTFRIEHVDLAVTIDPYTRLVAGTVCHHGRWIAGNRAEVVLDQHDLEITSVAVDGAEVAWSTTANEVGIPVSALDAFTIKLSFRAPAPRKGMYWIAPDAQRVAMAWTQGAMEDHSHWFPCYDSPNNLSTYRLAIRHRRDLQAVAGGLLDQRIEHGCDADGVAWVTSVYVQDRPHVLYLLTMVVGDLVAVDDPTASVPVTHWLPRGSEACAPAVFRATAFALRELAQFIGVPYPWQRYGHVVVHRFLWGGMENTTLTTISDRVLATPSEQQREDIDADSLVIHELVHQWFGDLLTMKGWSDIWLNESFATYLEARITARWRAHQGVASEADALALELWRNRTAYLEQHEQRYARPLVTNQWDDAYELFDRVAYEQGSLVLHTLASWLGAARFHAVLKLYTQRHAHDLVETVDVRQAIEDATGEPADWFFAQWLARAGHPALSVTWTHSPVRKQLAITITQKSPHYRLHLAIAAAGLPEQLIEFTEASQTILFATDSMPAWIAVDPRGEVLATICEQAEQPALIADVLAPAHARARACAAAAKKNPTTAMRAAVLAAINSGPAVVREQAIEALVHWRESAPLIDAYAVLPERERRIVVAGIGRLRGVPEALALAAQLLAWAATSTSHATIGELLAARGALEVAGATAALRPFLKQSSWNQRICAGAVRGLGASGEPAALDDMVCLAHEPNVPDGVLPLVMTAIGSLGARLPLARERCRRSLEAHLRHELITVRMAAAKALGTLGDPVARESLAAQREREVYGHARRVYREVLHQLAQVAATHTATAELTRRLSELEHERARFEQRLTALEKIVTQS